jgi:WD40 repeat protein
VTVAAAPPKSRVVVPETPYVGLTPFTESDAPFFFGREKERRIISANLLASRLTLLYGASGVGKSSIIRAGVQRDFRVRSEQALASGGFPESIVVVFTGWRDDPVSGLADCIAGSVKDLLGDLVPAPPRKQRRLDDLLVEWNRLLDEKAVERAGETGDLDEPVRTELLVIFDQFEQYFVYHGEEDGPDTFAVQFPQAVNREDLRASFLISLREDAYTQLDRFEGRILNLFASNLRIEHLDERAATDAIVKPVEKYNEFLGNGDPPYEVEPGLVKAVITQVRAGNIVLGQAGGGVVEHVEPEQTRVETPFLQLVMSRLWAEEQRRGSHVLREETLKNLGGAERIVRRHLDDAMSALGPDERAVASRMFHQLVTPSGSRIVHKADDLARYAGVTFEVAEPILERLDERRILRTIDPAPGEKTPRFEIRHDVLAGAVVEWCRQYEDRKRREEEEAKQREELERQRRRLYMKLGLGGALLLAFLIPAAVGGWYVWTARSDARAKRDAVRSILAVQDALPLLDKAPPDETVRAGYEAFVVPHAVPAAEEILRSALVASHRRGVFAGHKGNVTMAIFSPDGSRVATAGADGTARLWDPVAGTLLFTLPAARLQGQPAALNDIAFSPDGLLLATAGADGRARLWDVQTGHLRDPLRGHAGQVNSVAFSRDGRFVITGSDDGSARIWRTDDPDHAFVRALRGPAAGAVLSAAFSPDGRQAVTTKAEHLALLWNLARRDQPPLSLPAPTGRVVAASFSPDGRSVVTAGDEGVLRIWDTRTGDLIAARKGHRGPIVDARFSPTGHLVVTAGVDGTARLWRSDGRPVGPFLPPSKGPVSAASFSPDGAFVVTAEQGIARVWRTADRSLVTTLRGHNASDSVNTASFSPDESLVVTAGVDATARLWDPETGKPQRMLRTGGGAVSRLAVGHDSAGTVVALAGSGKGVQVWRLDPDRRAETLLPEVGSPTALAVSPDGKRIAATSADGTTRVVDIEDRQVTLLPAGAAHDVAFSPDGKLVIVGYDQGVRIWRLDERTFHAFSGGAFANPDRVTPVTDVAFSPDGRLVLTVAGTSAVVRDLRGRRQAILRGLSSKKTAVLTSLHGATDAGSGSVNTVEIVDAAFSPAGGQVVIGAKDGTAVIWNADRAPRQLLDRGSPVTSVSFSDDGKFVLTTSSDGRAGVWEADSGRLLAFFDEGAGLSHAALSPDDRLLITSGRSGVRVQPCDACLPIADLLLLGHWTKEELRKNGG